MQRYLKMASQRQSLISSLLGLPSLKHSVAENPRLSVAKFPVLFGVGRFPVLRVKTRTLHSRTFKNSWDFTNSTVTLQILILFNLSKPFLKVWRQANISYLNSKVVAAFPRQQQLLEFCKLSNETLLRLSKSHF